MGRRHLHLCRRNYLCTHSIIAHANIVHNKTTETFASHTTRLQGEVSWNTVAHRREIPTVPQKYNGGVAQFNASEGRADRFGILLDYPKEWQCGGEEYHGEVFWIAKG